MFSFGDFNNPNTKQKNTYTIYEVPVFIVRTQARRVACCASANLQHRR